MIILAAQRLFAQAPTAKSVIINEWSQGNSIDGASAEWVELLVVGNVAGCDTVLDLTGLRLQKAAGLQGDYIEFNNVPLWQDVPRGAIIVIYNGNNKSSVLPADDYSFAGDYKVVIGHNNATYFSTVGTTWAAATEMFANSFSATAQPVLYHNPSSTDIFVWGTDGPGASAYPGSNQLVYYTNHYNSGTFSNASDWEVKAYNAGYPGTYNTGNNIMFVQGLRNNTPSISIVTTSPVSGMMGNTIYFDIKLGCEIPAANVIGVSFKFERDWQDYFRVPASFYGTPYVSGYNLFGNGGGIALVDTTTEPGKINYSTIKTSGTTYCGSCGYVTRLPLYIQDTLPNGAVVNFRLNEMYAILSNGVYKPLVKFLEEVDVTFISGTSGGTLFYKVGKGDSDHNGTVGLSDVTALASKFGLQGGAIQGIVNWNTCSTVIRDPWGVDAGLDPSVPGTVLAMWCDHNGDGRVGNLDVLAIGFCWGSTYTYTKANTDVNLPLASSNLNLKVYDKSGRLVNNLSPNSTYEFVYSVKNAKDLLTASFELNWDADVEITGYKVSDQFKKNTTDFIEFVKIMNNSAAIALGRVWYDGPISGDEIELIRLTVKVGNNVDKLKLDLTNPEIRDESGKLYRLPVQLPELTTVPAKFALLGNYPNPFNPSTVIKFEIAQPTKASLKIYNSLGQLVKVLMENEPVEAGRYEKEFNAADLSSGVYFYKLETPEFTAIKKMVLIK
jgi:hypothetical protein